MPPEDDTQIADGRIGLPSRRITLAVPNLVCASVLDHLRAESPARVMQVDFGGGGKPVEVGVAEEILYVPALHLQVWRDRIVPYEANTDDAFRELQALSQAGEIMAHALFTNVPQYDEDVCVLSNLCSHEYNHFIEELSKVVILERYGFTGRYIFSTWPSRISQELPKFSIEFLDLLGIERERIVRLGRPTLLNSAWFTTRISQADAPDVVAFAEAAIWRPS